MFAEQYLRDEHGWVLFPSDIAYRKSLPFPPEVFEHPAKANLYLLEAIVDYVSKPGETILDPFGGTGSILVAGISGRDLIILELEKPFVEIIAKAIEGFQPDSVTLIPGDCRQVLPLACNHVVTSPPYGNILQGTGLKNVGKSSSDTAMNKYAGTGASTLNLGRLNPFLYGQHMRRVYQLLYESVKPGGTMTVIIKDRMKDGVREFLSEVCIRTVAQQGFQLQEWYKWKTPGTAQQKLMRSKGFDTVEDEDILIFARP